MTYLLLILTIFTWPFGQLLAFQFPGFPVTFYLLDIVLGLLIISLILKKKHRLQIVSDPIFKPILIFNLVAVLSLLINFKSLAAGGFIYPLLYLGRLFIYPSAYWAIKAHSKKNILKLITISFVLFCLLGILQYLFLPDMRYLKLIGFDDHYYRLIGSLYDPNFTGAILAGASLLFISLGSWAVSLPLVVLLALTFSRASYLCFLLGVIYLLISNKKYSLFFLLVCLGLLIWVIPKPFGEGVNLLRTFSIFSRIESWTVGINLFLQKPLLGWGYNTLRSLAGDRFQIDNSYLFVAATTGFLGLLSFLSFLKKALNEIPLPSKLFILTILIHSLFNNSFFYIWINLAFWVMLALPLKEYKQEK